MYIIFSDKFGRQNITFSCRDTDSIMLKIDNLPFEEFLKILKDNPHLFSKQLGLMELEIKENINQIISLRSKCYSIQPLSDVNNEKDKNYNLRKMKGVNANYKKRFHTHELYKKYYLKTIKKKKQNFTKLV